MSSNSQCPLGITQYSAATESEVKGSSGGAGSSWPGADDTTRPGDAAFANAVGEGRHLRIAEHSVPTASALAASSGEAGSARPGEKADAGVKAVARPAGGARPLVIAKHSTKTESDVAVSSGEAGPSWPRAMSTPSVFDTAVAMPAHEAWPPGITKQSAMMKPELAETSGEAGPCRSRVNGTSSAAATADAMPAGEARLTEFQSRMPRRSLKTRRVLVKLDLFGPGFVAPPKQAAAPAVATSADGVRPPGFAKHSATTESVSECPRSRLRGRSRSPKIRLRSGLMLGRR